MFVPYPCVCHIVEVLSIESQFGLFEACIQNIVLLWFVFGCNCLHLLLVECSDVFSLNCMLHVLFLYCGSKTFPSRSCIWGGCSAFHSSVLFLLLPFSCHQLWLPFPFLTSSICQRISAYLFYIQLLVFVIVGCFGSLAQQLSYGWKFHQLMNGEYKTN